MSGSCQGLPKSIQEKDILKNIEYPDIRNVYELAVELGIVNCETKVKTLAEWTKLTDAQIRKVKYNDRIELGMAIVFCVGVGATYESTVIIVRRALGIDLEAPLFFDYNIALRKACAYKETIPGERAGIVFDYLEKKHVRDLFITKYHNMK